MTKGFTKPKFTIFFEKRAGAGDENKGEGCLPSSSIDKVQQQWGFNNREGHMKLPNKTEIITPLSKKPKNQKSCCISTPWLGIDDWLGGGGEPPIVSLVFWSICGHRRP